MVAFWKPVCAERTAIAIVDREVRVDAEAVENGGVQVGGADRIGRGVCADVVALAVEQAL